MEINVQRINQVVAYVEEHLKDALTLDGVARASGISAYHLHRIFKALTGYPMVQYIRDRKLSQSAGELLNTHMSVLDIAQEYGFEYQQSYSRAFKRRFQVSPALFRKTPGTSIMLTPRLDLAGFRDAGGGVLRSPEYVIKKGFCIAGIRRLVADEDNYENATANKLAVDFFHRLAPRIPGRAENAVYYGYVADVPGTHKQSWYQPSVEVADLSRVPEDMQGVAVPTRRYAVFTYIGGHGAEGITYHILKDLYNAIFTDWIYRSGETVRDAFHFERIDLAECGGDFCRMDIYIPVKGILP